MIKKMVLVLVVLLLVIFGVAPLGLGYWADLRLGAVLERMSRSGDMDYTVTRFQRGWYSSTSEIVLKVGGGVGDAYAEYQRKAEVEAIAPLRLKLRNTIHHGPAALLLPHTIMSSSSPSSSDAESSRAPALAVVETRIIAIAGQELDAHASPMDLSYSIMTRIGFAGESVTRFDISPLQRVLQDMETKVEWQGVQGEIRYDPEGKRVVADVRAPGLAMANREGALELGGMGFSADLTEVAESISVGTIRLQLARLALNQEGQEDGDVLLQGLTVAGNSEASGELLHSHVKMELQHFTQGHQEYGPGIVSLVFRNLDIEVLSGISAQMRELQRQGLPQEQMGLMMGGHMISLLPQLLQRRPELELDQFRLETQQGAIQASGKMSINAEQDTALITPEMLKDVLVVEMSVRIPGTVLLAMNTWQSRNELLASGLEYSQEQIENLSRDMAQEKIDALVANHLLQREGEHYTFGANVERGQARVNGRLYPAPGS